jgi:hypothetical protein
MQAFRIHAFPGVAGACLAAVLSLATPATSRAQGATPNDPAEAAYQRDRTHCLAGMTHQARTDCLREAAAARDTARRQQLGNDAGPDAYRNNAMRRCERLPQADRTACEARIRGEGTTRGSVESGGIYRELVVPETPR